MVGNIHLGKEKGNKKLGDPKLWKGWFVVPTYGKCNIQTL